MKSRFASRLLAAAVGLAALAFAAPAAKAQTANLTFSGGLGTPLVLTLTNPVTYTVTAAYNGVLIFDLQNLGPTSLRQMSFNGSIAFSVNGGAASPITNGNSGNSGGSLSVNDGYLYNFSVQSALVAGDTITLGSGTLTSTTNDANARPADGSYQTFLLGSGTRISAAPEPETWAMLAVGGAVLVLWRVRRTRAV